MFPTTAERKRVKKEKAIAKQEKFNKWETGWQEKQRKGDAKKVKKVQKQRQKEENAKTTIEKNIPKYEIWGSKDQKGKMMIERYQLHRTKEEKEKQKIEAQNANPHVTPPPKRASEAIRSKIPPKTPETVRVYTPKVETDSPILSRKGGSSIGSEPKASNFTPSTSKKKINYHLHSF